MIDSTRRPRPAPEEACARLGDGGARRHAPESRRNPGARRYDAAGHPAARGRLSRVARMYRKAMLIEAEIKRHSEREDRTIAAYNAGPAPVGRAGGLPPLKTLQYVLGVGQYRRRELAALSSRLGAPEWELRLHNAFLAQRPLHPRQAHRLSGGAAERPLPRRGGPPGCRDMKRADR